MLSKAIDCLRTAFNVSPENRTLAHNLGLCLVTIGKFEEGWKYYEYRNSKITDFFKKIKEWNGEEINKKSIVVFNEQGLGDSIQFSKYILPLTKISRNVTFVVQKKIRCLLLVCN